MALPSTSVKFRLFLADGQPAVGAKVTARLTRPDTDAGGVVPGKVVGGTADSAGECVLALWPNARGVSGSQYSVVVMRGGLTEDRYLITVPDSETMVLSETIISQAPYPAVDAAQQALEAAQAATVVAQGHATTATTQAGIAASAAADAAQSAADAVSVIPVGGTTGQVLAKASDADYDTEWVPQTGGGGGGATNLAYTASPTGGTVTSDTGTDATIPLADGTNAGLMTPAEKAKVAATSGTNTGDQDLSGFSPTSHNHSGVYDPAGTAASAVSAHEGASDPHPGYVLESTIGVAGGVTPLDGTGKVASAYLPAYVDDVLEYANAGALPGTGVAGVIYVTLDDNKTWRWGGSSYTEISPSPGTTDAVPEGSTNLYHTAARVLGQVLTGLSTAAGTVVDATHTILQAIGFLQKQVSDNATAIGNKAASGAIGSSGLTMATAKLLGRSTAGTGAPEEITLGTNLSFSGTTLNAAGGGGTPGGSDTQVQFNDGGSAFGGDSGLTFDKTTKALSVGGATVTTSNPVLSATQTWNAGAVTFTGIKLNITDTASAGGSSVLDLMVDGSSVFRVRKDGRVFLSSSTTSNYYNAGSFATVSGETSVSWTFNGQTINVGREATITGAVYSSKGWMCANSTGLFFSSNTNGGNLIGLHGSSSGYAEVNSGTAGTYRDLKLRNLIGTGNIATGIVSKTANYTATANDGSIEVDATSGAVTITLPAVSGAAGRIYVIKKTDASGNAVTVDPNASETIDGATTVSLASQYSTITIQANAAGTAWHKLSGF